jgi:sigma-E factor negative regulatory protein RseA
MNTKDMSREQISALADGELSDQQLEVALAALRQQDARADWDVYHQIGDVLRSDDMAVSLSPEFSARMAARLEAEPAIVAPIVQTVPSIAPRPSRRWAIPGMVAAAAMAGIAFVTTPHLMVALQGQSDASAVASSTPALAVPSASESTVAASVAGDVVLRDPRIDDYLLAHQRFSPSVYSTAQYARSATFATDSSK